MPSEFKGIEPIRYIGIVYGYDVITRELDVFIPKLMPAIPETSDIAESITNLGNNNINSNLKYSSKIKTGSTIKVLPSDKDEPLPKIGSKVIIEFLENNINLGLWRKFNLNGDYEVIDSEKYKRLHKITINGSSVDVFEGDDIDIALPYSGDITIDENNKTKTINIPKNLEVENRLSLLEYKIKFLLGQDTLTGSIPTYSQTVLYTGRLTQKTEIGKLINTPSEIKDINAFIKNSGWQTANNYISVYIDNKGVVSAAPITPINSSIELTVNIKYTKKED